MSITDETIHRMRHDAANAGDIRMVATCDRALAGNAKARAIVEEAVRDAEAMDDENDIDTLRSILAPVRLLDLQQLERDYPDAKVVDCVECGRVVLHPDTLPPGYLAFVGTRSGVNKWLCAACMGRGPRRAS